MMKKTLSLLLLITTGILLVQAQEVTPVTILPVEEMPKAEKFLPDYPKLTDPLFYNDLVQYEKGKALRETPRGQQAHDDATLKVDYFLKRFGEAMGCEMTAETHPAMATFIFSTYRTARLSIQSAKDYYKRRRPYSQFKEPSGVPEEERENDLTSYPSGHTIRAWAIALALVGIDPAHQDEIMKVGYELGQSRVIVGFHYQSDVDAARLAGSAAFARMCVEPVWQKLYQKAKKELEKSRKQ